VRPCHWTQAASAAARRANFALHLVIIITASIGAQSSQNDGRSFRLRVISTLLNTYGDSGVISVPAGFRRHLVGKTLRNVFTVISLKYELLACW